jgi:phage tail sheath protein FI
MGQLLRLARRVGEELTFEASGEALWTRIRERFEDLLTALWQLGALKGASPAQAFDVRCGRDVMTQSDLDAGRVVCVVSFTPAAAIDRIRVHLALAEDGSVVWSDDTTQVEALP